MTALLDAPVARRTDPRTDPRRPDLATDRATQLSDLAPIDRPTLVAAGGLLTRVDRKYLVPAAILPDLLDQVRDAALALEIERHRRFGYRTVYFDTPEADSYLAATRRRRRRHKVRTRIYLDTGDCYLEVKTKDGRGRTVKTRIPYPLQDADRLSAEAHSFLIAELAPLVADPADEVARLAPTISTHYQRATLFLPADRARVTIDTDLVASARTGSVLRVEDRAIVETKSGASASAMDRLLWRSGSRPLKVSKFASCLAALDPELPATKWRPALRRIESHPTPTSRHQAPRREGRS